MGKATWVKNLPADHIAFKQGYLRNTGVNAKKLYADEREPGTPDDPTDTKTPKPGVLTKE